MKNLFRHLGLIVLILVLQILIHRFLTNLGSAELTIGVFKVRSIYNSAFIFGLFNETSYFIRIAFTSVLLGLIWMIASYFYAFLAPELKLLRWGMTIFMAGITGNAFEKLANGAVLDFLAFDLPELNHIYFNLSDVLQILGIIIVVREIFKNQSIIWFPHPVRRKALILYKEIQVLMVAKILGLFLIGSLTQGILAIALLFPQLKRGSHDVQVLFILCLLLLNLLLLPLISRFFMRELLRYVGPVFALEKYLGSETLPEAPLKFRSTDHFKNLEVSFNKFIQRHLKSNSPKD